MILTKIWKNHETSCSSHHQPGRLVSSFLKSPESFQHLPAVPWVNQPHPRLLEPKAAKPDPAAGTSPEIYGNLLELLADCKSL